MNENQVRRLALAVAVVVVGLGVLVLSEPQLFEFVGSSGKLRVLIVEESGDRTPEVASILGSKQLRDYCLTHCEMEDGQPAFRVFDKDSPLDKLPEGWQKIAKRPHSSYPWLTIASGGKYRYDGPLLRTLDTTMSLLKKYGGD